MDILNQLFQSNPFALPLFIFAARIMDVSLGTLRIISLSRGRKYLAPILGFFEVFIWVVAISQLVRNLTHISGYLAYAAGFAAGNYIGMWLEEKLAMGMLTLRIFAVREGPDLSKRLAAAGFGVTTLPGHGAESQVEVLFVIIQRRNLNQVVQIIREVNPRIFYSVEEVRASNQGVFPTQSKGTQRYTQFFNWAKRK